ncbi:mutS protein homolog 5 isoform X2 [Andrena cerasifolii]|uniref:mutS protein homolog 5 isoform X2 n=1 Tax=Andrena cerasifolii TaxID=2819439 RepID=UPI004037C383
MSSSKIAPGRVPASSSATRSRSTPTSDLIRYEFESLISESSDEEEAEVEAEEETSVRVETASRREPTGREATINSNTFDANASVDTDEIILSVIWNKNKLGAAYYDLVTSELFVMEDATGDAECLDVTKALYRQCQPHYVVTVSGTPVRLTNLLKKMLVTGTLNEESNSFASGSRDRAQVAELKTLNKREHSYERCFHRVRCLQLESEPTNTSNADRLHFLNSILNFKCCAMIHALGLLLLFIDKSWSSIALDPSGKASFLSLNYVTFQDLLVMDEDTYEALNIVQARDHPSLFKFGKTTTKTKGASLFSLFSRYCQSRPGAQFLWKTLHHPTRNVAVLEERLDTVEFFLDPNNQGVVESLSCCLRHVYRLTNAILACCSGLQATAANWQKVHKTISHVIFIGDLCENYADRIGLLKRISESTTNEMQYVKYFIEYIVDFGESRRERKLVVKPNVDPLLDELNHVRRTLPELLTRMGERDMREHLPASVTECNMLYLPNIGYVLAINKWNPTPPEDVTFPDLEFKFSINDVHYYKSPSARELDESVGDIILKIAVRENRIVQKLTRYARKHTGAILRATELCAELDTKVARDYNYTRPKITKSKLVEVKQARHPLLECWTTFVPNDIRSGDGSSLIKVLTGPNCCGKSVYLRQIGLVIFMAHIGSYVSAKSAVIGTVSHIFAQISTTESVGLHASSFLQNLRQINVALRASTPTSVVITDELDRGTSEISGLSLVAAVLNTFAERGTECPHVFAATHARPALALLAETPLIEVQTFEYLVDENESLTFLHRLTNGSTTRSFAHFIARTADVDEVLVKRSLEVLEKMKQGALPSSIHRRTDSLRRIIQLSRTPGDFDLEEMKSLVRDAIDPS